MLDQKQLESLTEAYSDLVEWEKAERRNALEHWERGNERFAEYHEGKTDSVCDMQDGFRQAVKALGYFVKYNEAEDFEIVHASEAKARRFN